MFDWLVDVFNSFFGNPSQAWDRFKNGRSNEINQEIAEQNLEYQKERNAIEDARYEEETDYNRQWAEEERSYNRALQQQLFEREDTAMSRQAADLASIGINPLSANMSGANAGQAVSSATPSTASDRGGSALHNDFNAIPGGVEGVLSALSGIADTVNGVATGQYQRDSLALQNDSLMLDNMIKANKNGIQYYQPSSKKPNKLATFNGFDEDYWNNIAHSSEGYDKANQKREYESKVKNNIFDWESPQTRLAKSLGTLDFQDLAENLLTNVAKAGNWVNGNLKDFSKDMENSAIMKFIAKFFAF